VPGAISEAIHKGHHGRRWGRTVLQNGRFRKEKEDPLAQSTAHVISFDRRTYPALIKLRLNERSASFTSGVTPVIANLGLDATDEGSAQKGLRRA
jgi:hypothetical protein